MSADPEEKIAAGAAVSTSSVVPWDRFLPALLLSAVAVAFSPTLYGGWFWDDLANVERNPTLDAADGLRRIWTDPRASYQYYPLTYSGFWLEHQVFGDRPAPFHCVNIVLHGVNGLLVWRVLLRLAAPQAALAAFLFALHPLQVETVGWITELKNLLATMFSLLTILAWDRFGAIGRSRWYAAALTAFTAALLSKTVALTLAPSLVVWEWCVRPATWRKKAWALVPLALLGLAAGAMTSWRETLTADEKGQAYLMAPQLSLAQKALVVGRAAWFYVGKLLWPVRLSAVYPRWSPNPANGFEWLWPLTVGAVLAGLWLARGRIGCRPLLAALFYGLTLGPTLGAMPFQFQAHSYVADHFAYFACVGPIALFAALVGRLPANARTLVAIGASVLLTVCTFQHASTFADSVQVWRATTELNPAAWAAFNNLGEALADRKQMAEAIQAFENALRVEPNNASALYNLGTALAQVGRFPEAAERLRAAAALRPREPQILHHLGNVLANEQDWPAAADAYERALNVNPDEAQGHFALALVQIEQNRWPEAEKHLLRALELAPALAAARAVLDHERAVRFTSAPK